MRGSNFTESWGTKLRNWSRRQRYEACSSARSATEDGPAHRKRQTTTAVVFYAWIFHVLVMKISKSMFWIGSPCVTWIFHIWKYGPRVLFVWYSRSLCFLFHLSLCANARRSRTQPGRFVTCVSGGHGARRKGFCDLGRVARWRQTLRTRADWMEACSERTSHLNRVRILLQERSSYIQ